MTDALLMVLDTLLPGDDGGASNRPLPCFSMAAIDAAPLAPAAGPILALIEPTEFTRAAAADRLAILRNVEGQAPDQFRAFLGRALAAYYQAPSVLAALDWRSDPPQPAGHQLEGGDDAALLLLDKVRRRGEIWRG